MTSLDDLLRVHGRLTTVHVERWVERGLLRPSAEGDAWVFETVDVARARLLAELVDEMGFDDESVETVIDLLDQVHTLRGQLDLLGHAISEQPAPVREAIAAALQRLGRREGIRRGDRATSPAPASA
ncbi:MAG: chaperone modulator CbpM [Reyranella sp.]